jgi:hypothetical protein
MPVLVFCVLLLCARKRCCCEWPGPLSLLLKARHRDFSLPSAAAACHKLCFISLLMLPMHESEIQIRAW